MSQKEKIGKSFSYVTLEYENMFLAKVLIAVDRPWQLLVIDAEKVWKICIMLTKLHKVCLNLRKYAKVC